MDPLILQLKDLSVAAIRQGSPLAALSQLEGAESFSPHEVSFPTIGAKFQFEGLKGEGIITYIFLYMQDGTLDWLHRLNGVDTYGATFQAFSGEIRLGEKVCSREFLHDPDSFLTACTSFRLYRREPFSVTFILNGDQDERRLALEFSKTKSLTRLVLY